MNRLVSGGDLRGGLASGGDLRGGLVSGSDTLLEGIMENLLCLFLIHLEGIMENLLCLFLILLEGITENLLCQTLGGLKKKRHSPDHWFGWTFAKGSASAHPRKSRHPYL